MPTGLHDLWTTTNVKVRNSEFLYETSFDYILGKSSIYIYIYIFFSIKIHQTRWYLEKMNLSKTRWTCHNVSYYSYIMHPLAESFSVGAVEFPGHMAKGSANGSGTFSWRGFQATTDDLPRKYKGKVREYWKNLRNSRTLSEIRGDLEDITKVISGAAWRWGMTLETDAISGGNEDESVDGMGVPRQKRIDPPDMFKGQHWHEINGRQSASHFAESWATAPLQRPKRPCTNQCRHAHPRPGSLRRSESVRSHRLERIRSPWLFLAITLLKMSIYSWFTHHIKMLIFHFYQVYREGMRTSQSNCFRKTTVKVRALARIPELTTKVNETTLIQRWVEQNNNAIAAALTCANRW